MKIIKTIFGLCTAFSIFVLSVAVLTKISLPEAFYSDSSNKKINFRTSGISVSVGANSDSSVAVQSTENGQVYYDAEVKAMGFIPVETTSVKVKKAETVKLCGKLFGVKIYADGVIIVGFSDVDTTNGAVNPAKKAGLEKGDIIESIDGIKVCCNEDVSKIINEPNVKQINVKYLRNNKSYNAFITPVLSNEGIKKVGMWVRDSCAGIGTVTYIDSNGIIAGLGHGICDVDTGEIIPVNSGKIVSADIVGIIKGTKGSTGQLTGNFSDEIYGELLKNTETGIYGKTETELEGDSYEVAFKQEIKTGQATLIATIDGEGTGEYSCRIKKIDYSSQNNTRNMIIEITDKRIKDKTGGIVQGMSGCPIIQNGKFIGAVTHVFVDDPLCGYAIFSENMTAYSDSISN